MKNTLSQLFRWHPSSETLVGLAAGIAVIALSAVMTFSGDFGWLRIVIRDIGQILIVGIIFPLAYILRTGNNFSAFGLSLKNWPIFLLINFSLGMLLLFLFLSRNPAPLEFHLTASIVWTSAYVMLALCFELIFFYAFLRTLLVRAFGAVPAIVLTALFYTFHHVGFQPEYKKLFFVGLLYATTYHLGNSALLIFPFFLGIGGIYDVLVQSQIVSPIPYPEIRTLYLTMLVLPAVFLTWRTSRQMNT